MKIQERYSVARNTSNLKSEDRTTFSPSDVIAAAGMTAQQNETAMLLWEVTFRGKTSAKLALVDRLERDLTMHMLKTGRVGKPRLVVLEVIAWWLHGTCQSCGGKGYETILGTPALSDRLCKHCGGTGKVPLPSGEAYTWLIDRLQRFTALAGGHLMRKRAPDLDL